MNALLRRTISYHDYREDFTMLFSLESLPVLGIWWIPIRSMERGRSDVVVYDSINARGCSL